MTTVAAATQGTAAAEDAVTEATAIGIGTGSPIYFDMEAYTPIDERDQSRPHLPRSVDRRSCTRSASSPASTPRAAPGSPTSPASSRTGYPLPDDIWTANWNNQENTLDSVLPSTAWANHQRIHQFRGGHDDTYGGTTINIDSDFVDGATVGVGTPPVGESDPIGTLEVTGSPAHGPAAGQGLGARPRRADRSALDQRRGRRPRRRQGRRNLRTRARSPTSNAPTSPPRTSWPGRSTASKTRSSRPSRGRSRSASTRSTRRSAATACSAAGRRRSRSRSPSPACALTRTRRLRQRHLRVPRRHRMPRPPRPAHDLQSGDPAPPQSRRGSTP